jgi:hypothetical protein
MLLACFGDQELMLSLGKSDSLIWHSGLSGFPALGPSHPTGGRHICNDRLLHSILRGQNPVVVYD